MEPQNVVRALAPFLDAPRLKKGDVQVLESILMGQLNDILAHADVVEDDVRAPFERLHGADLTAVEDAERQDARADMEDMFADMGIDVDLAAQAAQLADELKRHAAESETRSRSTRRRTKRAQREDDLRQRAEEVRNISLGSIYRQLAKVRHPDLEQDPEQRTRKGALMQQLTTAYASQDLHTLLRLQLEWVSRFGSRCRYGFRTDGWFLITSRLRSTIRFNGGRSDFRLRTADTRA